MKMSLKKQEATPPKGSVLVNLPLTMVSALKQMRATFSTASIEELAASLVSIGQLNYGIVVALLYDEALKYVATINKTWGTSFTLEKFHPVHVDEKELDFYFFIVAGERRYRACKHAKLPTYYCQLRFGMNFSDAVALQVQENLHEQVKQEEAAALFALLWRTQKGENPALTLQQFAKKLGKTLEAIRRSVRYMSLPVDVQALVLPNTQIKSKGVSYGILCELARLQEARVIYATAYNKNELIRLAYILVNNYKTIKAVSHYISQQIAQMEQGAQKGLDGFELCLQEVVTETKKQVASGLEETLRNGEQHLERVAAFHKSRVIGKVTSGAAVTAVERVIATATELAPQIIRGIQGARGAAKVSRVLALQKRP